MYDRSALVALFREKALRFGEFTLASGKKASYYLDGKQVTLDSQGARLVGEGVLEALEAHAPLPAAVGGMSIGADPIIAAVLAIAGLRGLPLAGVMVRKQPKGHGTNRYLEGPVQPGDTVAIVEDVVTTGGSSLEAIARCEEFGLRVVRVVAIVDRCEGGGEAFAQRGYPFTSLLTLRDFGLEPPSV
jgi:orotate phosphoribosyltransferase